VRRGFGHSQNHTHRKNHTSCAAERGTMGRQAKRRATQGHEPRKRRVAGRTFARILTHSGTNRKKRGRLVFKLSNMLQARNMDGRWWSAVPTGPPVLTHTSGVFANDGKDPTQEHLSLDVVIPRKRPKTHISLSHFPGPRLGRTASRALDLESRSNAAHTARMQMRTRR
jgi:hypothetical protein